MGNFHTNYTLRGPSQQAVAKALAGRSAIVTPVQNGCVVVFDARSDEQDQEVITEVATRLSREFGSPVLAVLNHDDDIFWYQLYIIGELQTSMTRHQVTSIRRQNFLIRREVTHKSFATHLEQAM